MTSTVRTVPAPTRRAAFSQVEVPAGYKCERDGVLVMGEARAISAEGLGPSPSDLLAEAATAATIDTAKMAEKVARGVMAEAEERMLAELAERLPTDAYIGRIAGEKCAAMLLDHERKHHSARTVTAMQQGAPAYELRDGSVVWGMSSEPQTPLAAIRAALYSGALDDAAFRARVAEIVEGASGG